MTPRGARLVAAVAGLSWGAAALAALAPSLPEGLAAACGPGNVARELLAGLALVALLLAPALAADEPGRPAEWHGSLWAVLPGLPAAAALAAAGGGSPADLLPAAALLLACDLAASSWLRADPAGRFAVPYAAAAAALLAALPVAAYGLAEFGGWEGAAAAFRLSPLLAARDPAGGWGAVAPAALLLVAAAAVLRLGPRAAGAGAAAALAAAALLPAPAGAAEGPPARRPPVLVLGAPREGAAAQAVGDLGREGLAAAEVDALPDPLPWETEVVVLGRGARDAAEAASWARALRPFVAAGGRVSAPDRATVAGILGLAAPPASAEAGHGLGWARAREGGDGPGPGRPLARSAVALPHPAAAPAGPAGPAGPEPGVRPALFRVPFPPPPRDLPGRTLGFLAVLAAAFAGCAALARRRGLGQGTAGASLAGIAAAGTALLHLPGVLAPPVHVDRFVLEERVEGREGGRRLEILRVERVRPGGGDPVPAAAPGAAPAELLFAPDAERALGPGGAVRLPAPGRWALLASVSDCDTQPPGPPWLASVLLGGPGGPPPAEALGALRRSADPRVSLAGSLLAECLRPPPGSGPLLVAVPAAGPLALVLHRER